MITELTYVHISKTYFVQHFASFCFDMPRKLYVNGLIQKHTYIELICQTKGRSKAKQKLYVSQP